MDITIKQEILEDSYNSVIKIENPTNHLEAIEFSDCNVKKEITDEGIKVEDPLQLIEMEINEPKTKNYNLIEKKNKSKDLKKTISRTVHKSVKCFQCEKVFGKQVHLNRHIKTIHEGVRG